MAVKIRTCGVCERENCEHTMTAVRAEERLAIVTWLVRQAEECCGECAVCATLRNYAERLAHGEDVKPARPAELKGDE